LSGERWRPLYLPVGVVAAAAGAAERALRMVRRRSPVSQHQVRRATYSAHYDCSRAERLLGWRPAVTVEDGLRRTFAALRADAPSTGAPAIAGLAR
jgi:nucleoside-diphosphate-sugar epimerase